MNTIIRALYCALFAPSLSFVTHEQIHMQAAAVKFVLYWGIRDACAGPFFSAGSMQGASYIAERN